MDTLTTGMLALRIAKVFAHDTAPLTDAERDRLSAGTEFLDRTLVATSFLETGEAKGLEPTALSEVEYTQRTLRDLTELAQLGKGRVALEAIRKLLADEISSSRTLEKKERQLLSKFFEFLGGRMISEVSERRPEEDASDDGEAKLF